MDKKIYQIDAQHALHYDIVQIICKFADWKSLSNMAAVCKSWYRAVLREKFKRYYIQQLRLLYKNDKRASTLHLCLPYKISKVDRALLVKPHVSLFVYETKLERSSFFFEHRLLKDLKKQLPNKTIVLKVDEYLTTEDRSITEGQCNLKRGNGDIMGIFFPSERQQVRIHAAWIEFDKLLDRSPNRNATLANRLIDDLGLNKCEYPKSAILLLTYYFEQSNTHDTIIRELGKRIQRSGKEVTLGSLYALKLVGTCKTESRQSYWKSYVTLRITGPSVESWSTFIHYGARRCDINRKLRELREKVRSKRYRTGLLCMPKCAKLRCAHVEHPCGNSRKMMYSLKRTFPDVRFTGFFINCTELHNNPPMRHRVPDAYQESDALNSDFLDRMYLYASIIIIAYD